MNYQAEGSIRDNWQPTAGVEKENTSQVKHFIDTAHILPVHDSVITVV